MSFVLPNDLDSTLGFSDDVCAIAYAMYHDKDLVVGLWGYYNEEYSVNIKQSRNIPAPAYSREILHEGYFSVLSDVINVHGTLYYASTILGTTSSCVMSYDGTANEYKVRNVAGHDQIKLPDLSYHPILDLNDWTDEMYFQQSLVLTDWELLGSILCSTLQHEKFLSLRIDIGHMCVIIQESSKDKLHAMREFYAGRDKTKESPLFKTASSSGS